MSQLRAFGAFWWDFLVGDDPWIAIGVAVTLTGIGVVRATNWPTWWVLPVVSLGLMGWSLARAAGRTRKAAAGRPTAGPSAAGTTVERSAPEP
jgi:hypothetical protein